MDIKRGVIGILFIVLVVMLSSNVLGFDGRDFAYSVVNGVKEVAAPIFGALFGMYESDEFLFTKILLFILLFVLVRAGVKATPLFESKHGLANIISLVVSLFAVRFLSEGDLINGILLPYGTLGVAIIVLIPFVLFFFLVEKTGKSPAFRKGAWFVYFAIMAILWFNRRNEIDEMAGYIYLGVIAISILMFFFDKHVQDYFGTRANNDALKKVVNARIAALQAQYESIASVNSPSADATRKDIVSQIKKEEKILHDIS